MTQIIVDKINLLANSVKCRLHTLDVLPRQTRKYRSHDTQLETEQNSMALLFFNVVIECYGFATIHQNSLI